MWRLSLSLSLSFSLNLSLSPRLSSSKEPPGSILCRRRPNLFAQPAGFALVLRGGPLRLIDHCSSSILSGEPNPQLHCKRPQPAACCNAHHRRAPQGQQAGQMGRQTAQIPSPPLGAPTRLSPPEDSLQSVGPQFLEWPAR